MNEQPSEKPVREILQQLRVHSEFPVPPRSFVDPKMVDRVTFFCTVTGLVLSALILVVMIWETEVVMTGLKLIATIWVLLAAMIMFRAVNASFGE